MENAIVDRIFGSSGVAVHEEFQKRDGSTGKSYFTLWFTERPQLEIGQRISASGFHGVKVDEYERNGETRHTANVSVNSARLIGSAPPVDPAPQDTGDSWSTPSGDAWGGEF
ncbi:hypothetical protein CQ044_16675 [Microbacterium sp. MYb64]|nr:hypothetical protein CQ044_16675 [Microbacterium sp. MYb64]